MRSLKKLITMMLAIAMVLSCVSISAMAKGSFSDITDPKVDDAVGKLVAYKIITGYDDDNDGVAESFKPDNQITRAEFAAIVTRMKGVADNLPTDAVTGFADLDSDPSRAWARPYVKAAVNLKVINGFEDGTFRAGDPVTYEQAVKMLVCAVGYEVVANSELAKIKVSNPNATWSAGYISAANRHGITKGVITAMVSEPASRGVVAVLTSNALEVPALESDNKGNLVKPDNGGETESNMQTITGIITATHFTGLDEADPGLQEDEIYIDSNDNDDDGEYKLSDSLAESLDFEQYIGRRVDAYYDNLEGEITSIKLKSASSEIIEEGSIESISGYSVKYKDERGKTTSEDLNSYTFIVNGKYVDEYDLNNLKNGKIEFFTTGQYKVAKVSDYKVFVVNSFDKENEKIFLKYENYEGNNYYEFPTRASDKPEIFVKNSGSSAYTKTDFENLYLSQYDIINYLESPSDAAGDKVLKMYVTKGAKSGKVTAKLDGEREVELGNDTYYLTQQYYNFAGNSNDEKAPFELSENYTYYLDYTGQIAAVKYSATASTGTWKYGYLVEVEKKDKVIGIIDANGNYKTGGYELKDTVRVDGAKTKASNVFDILKEAAEVIDANANDDTLTETNGYAQPIRYSESGGKIDGIDTVLEGEGGANDNFTYDGQLGSSAKSTTTTKVTVGSTSYAVNSTTLVVYAPKDRTDDSSYAVMKPSAAFAVTANRYVETFAVDSTSSNNLSKFVVVYGSNPTLNFIGNTPSMIVSKIRNTSDTREFTGYAGNNGAEVSVKVSEDGVETEIEGNDNLVTADDVEVGDIIRYIKDNKGEIIAIEMIYDASEEGKLLVNAEEDYFRNIEGTGADFVACYGSVNAKDETDKTIEVLSDKTRTYKTGSSKIFKLKANGDVITGVIDEISVEADGGEASNVVILTNNSTDNASATVIYIIE